MIDFEIPTPIKRQVQFITMLGEQVMRPVARYYDEHEMERPWDYINLIWPTIRDRGGRSFSVEDGKEDKEGKPRPRIGYLMLAHVVEALSWGDAGLYLCTPGSALAVRLSMRPARQSRRSAS
jgi:hypothetical protein